LKTARSRSKGGATVADVAKAASVSMMTVSRVMNDAKNVSESKRALVLRAARELDYVPNLAARTLASSDAFGIALLHSNPSTAYLSKLLIGALEASRGLGCHLVVEHCETESAEERAEVIGRLSRSEVRGIILPPPLSGSTALLAELRSADILVATIATNHPGESPLNVRMDDFLAAAEMTRYLLQLGHRKIGFINGPPNQIASHDRLHGFAAALAEHGFNAEKYPVAQGDFTYHSGLVAADRLLSAAVPPTAVFASNDDMAAATLAVANRRGLSVPHDLTVVGFDDTSLATTVWPELTTVRQPITEMAESAMKLLLERLRTKDRVQRRSPVERFLKHSLIVRGSSAGPRHPGE
jgi:LacI family transcriptional regulator